MRQELDHGLSRAFVFQARATGNLGRLEEAAALARRSWETYPSAESAREIARWLARLNKNEEAVQALADAFSISDPRTTDEDRAKDRARMGELYRKVKGSESGLGDIILAAYDRTAALLARRREAERADNPNAGATDPLEFTLTGVKGDKLEMRSLKGKVIVLDFWATWCGPCRVQHPLYEQVKAKFKQRPDVVFVAVNTDEDRSLVAPFLVESKWNKAAYFEDGLSSLLRVSSIPTTIIFNKRGELFSRLNGFLPDRFVGMLTERIEQALAE
jgi:thiol-disulfide isomerase/thioredoxin